MCVISVKIATLRPHLLKIIYWKRLSTFLVIVQSMQLGNVYIICNILHQHLPLVILVCWNDGLNLTHAQFLKFHCCACALTEGMQFWWVWCSVRTPVPRLRSWGSQLDLMEGLETSVSLSPSSPIRSYSCSPRLEACAADTRSFSYLPRRRLMWKASTMFPLIRPNMRSLWMWSLVPWQGRRLRGGRVPLTLQKKSKFVPRTFSLDSCVLDMLRF